MRGKINLLFILVISISLFCGIVLAASESGTLDSTAYGWYDTASVTSGGSDPRSLFYRIQMSNVQNFKNVSLINYRVPKASYSSLGYGTSTFKLKVTDTSTHIATGSVSVFSESSTNAMIQFQFDYWNIGSLTGVQSFEFYDFSGSASGSFLSGGGHSGTGNGYEFYMEYAGQPATKTSATIYFHTDYSNEYIFNDTSALNGFATLTVNRLSSPSTVNVTSGGDLVLNEYKASGNSQIIVWENPVLLDVGFTDGTHKTKTFGIDNPLYGPTVTTTTPTPTPTPDISPSLCGYWSFAVNASNIVRNGYVTGTLTESDPDNKHKKIDWYVVLPSGQEITKKSFVYDDGFFGLGAGWIEIDVSTGSASASSEAAAKANSLQYVMAGNNQKMRVKIYEDKSLIPLAYHDYHLFCTLDQTVHVSETTQGLSVWNINAYDQLTNNLISGITVHLYDYQSGEWQNKTTLIGGSYQFNVVPGNKYRIYIDESYWNTYDEDYTIPSPVPSQPYPVYLIRPLEAIEDASWVMFYVRDGSTLNLMGGVSIALSDGQIQSTSGSGFAKFNVSDSTLYYWSASKTGYTGQSGTFNISSDTLLPDVYLYPAGVVTTPTTIPYWTQTPTPLPTYANGTVIPGYTYAPTVTATLNVVERDQKLTESTDIWYRFAPFLSQLIFIVVVVGLLGLMTKSLGGGGSGGRRRRY